MTNTRKPETSHSPLGRLLWAIQPEALASIETTNYRRLASEQLAAISESISLGPSAEPEPAGEIAIIPLQGVITPYGSFLLRLLGFGSAGLMHFRAVLQDAVNDDNVGAIILNVDSPGGLVDLVPETAAEIRTARGKKPIVAVANTCAASAAYYLAAQADEVVVTPSGEVGSIGVLSRHEDISAMLEKDGVKITLISAGKFKTEGNPFEPLTKEAKQAMQAAVDEFYDMFVTDVAAGRGISKADVEEKYGQGRTMLAAQALEAGMVDRVATIEETIARLGGDIEDEDDPEGEDEEDGTEGRLPSSSGRSAGSEVHAIPSHRTATDDTEAFDGPKFETYIQGSAGEVDQGMRAFSAWESTDYSRPKPKKAFKIGHHLVSSAGEVGAASVRACTNGIAVLNGARGGIKIPDSDRQGVYDHLAAHLRDAGKTPPPLKSAEEAEIRREADGQLSDDDRARVATVLFG